MIIPTLLLTILGIVVIYSSSPGLALQQVIFATLGVIFYFGLRRFDYRALKTLIRPLYFITLFSLVIVFLLGVETRGALRWIPLGPFNFQPSEFAKPVLILILAEFWTKRAPSWRNIAKSFGIVLPIAALIFKQPDLGTTITILFIWLIMLITSDISFFKLAVMTLAGIVAAPLTWFFMKDYQRQRIISFLSPNQDPQGIGYNVIQSTIAIGSGEWFGRGLGQGTQSRLRFLPEFRTDFIFSSIAEELGLLGTVIVLALYLVVFLFLFRIISRANNRFGEMIAIGTASMLFVQIMVNIGMNTGILPVTGITLPLLSYGGSSMITVFLALGLSASVEKYSLKKKEIQSFSI